MTRQQPADARRRAILDAASSLLLDKGLAGTSVDAVAKSAGIAKGTVYLYFASRSDLLAALRARYSDGLASQARSILDSAQPDDAGSVSAAFQRLTAALLDYVLANQRLYHVLFQEAGVPEQDTMQPLRELIRDTLQRAMDAGALEPVDPEVLMRFLLDGLHGVLRPLVHAGGRDRERVLASIGEVVSRVLTPAGESPGPRR